MTHYNDPRLTNPLLLAMAAQRVRYKREHPAPEPWLEGAGISALIAYARTLPPRSQADEDASVYEGAPGMGGLLWQARQWLKDREQGQ